MHTLRRCLSADCRPRWNEAIARARNGLAASAATFAEAAMKLQSYQDRLVERERVEADAIVVFASILDALATDNELPGSSIAVAKSIGKERAALGVSLSDLMTIVRIDAYVIWDRMLEALGPTDAELLAQAAPFLWQTIEQYGNAIEQGYVSESKSQLQSLVRQRRLLPMLVNGTPLGPEDLSLLARAMRSEVTDDYVVCACTPRYESELAAYASRITTTAGAIPLLHSAGTFSVLVCPPGSLHGSRGVGLPCMGVSEPVSGLHNVHRAVRQALEIDSVRYHDEICALRYADVWDRLVSKSMIREHSKFHENLADSLARANDSDQLISAVMAVATTASISDAAAQLFCHRNTIQNRLARVSTLTGLDLRYPRNLAMVYLALLGHPRQRAIDHTG